MEPLLTWATEDDSHQQRASNTDWWDYHPTLGLEERLRWPLQTAERWVDHSLQEHQWMSEVTLATLMEQITTVNKLLLKAHFVVDRVFAALLTKLFSAGTWAQTGLRLDRGWGSARGWWTRFFTPSNQLLSTKTLTIRSIKSSRWLELIEMFKPYS